MDGLSGVLVLLPMKITIVTSQMVAKDCTALNKADK
jgi:hypothetical protein